MKAWGCVNIFFQAEFLSPSVLLQIVCTSRVDGPTLPTSFVAFRISNWWVPFHFQTDLFALTLGWDPPPNPLTHHKSNAGKQRVFLEEAKTIYTRLDFFKGGRKNNPLRKIFEYEPPLQSTCGVIMLVIEVKLFVCVLNWFNEGDLQQFSIDFFTI